MLNVVLYEPEIPGNTGNVMRTCVATNVKLHLIKPLGFNLSDASIKRSGVNYINDCDYEVYENINDFYNQNNGEFYYFTRYGHKTHNQFNYKEVKNNIYLVFGKESTGLPLEILKTNIKNCIRFPMTNKVRAINLSNSVAIGVYEVLRQLDYPGLLFDEPHKSLNYIEEN
ncbi:MAG: tRNA (cytidine(34)-2'-O)-methyltransferase [Bacilli bacterium]|nr:tRNA (cytidine(34)-2'-O)-methyltransferase [Bacilli bacterium]